MHKGKKVENKCSCCLVRGHNKIFFLRNNGKNVCLCVCSLQCGKVTSTSQIFELSLPDSGPVYIVAPNVHTAQWRIVKIKVFSSFKNQVLLSRSL